MIGVFKAELYAEGPRYVILIFEYMHLYALRSESPPGN